MMQVPLEIKTKYLTRRIQDIEYLRKTIEEGDYTFALRLGHQVKGNAVTFDAPQIAAIGSDLEKAAFVGDRELICDLVQQMELEIQMLQSKIH